jgi:hypothetical protein
MPFAPETGKNIKFRLSTALMTAAEVIAVIPRPAEGARPGCGFFGHANLDGSNASVHSRSITILSTEPAKMYFLENSSITAGCFVDQVDSDAVYPALRRQTLRPQIFFAASVPASTSLC